jgi:L1 cell adhesion molecule like protein
MKNTLKDEKLKDVFSAEEKTKLEALIEETTKWIEANANAETEDFKKKLKELEEVFHPIMQRVYA